MKTTNIMKVAIFGTGGAALATAALVSERGCKPILVSVTGKGGEKLHMRTLYATGAINGEVPIELADSAEAALAQTDDLVIATSADRYRDVFDAIVPFTETRHRILFSAELSQASKTLSRELQKRGVTPVITALSTTLATGRRGPDANVKVGLIRKSSLAHTLPTGRGVACSQIFGDVLTPCPSHLRLTLSNLNPIVHIPNALCNVTRIEKGEEWSNYGGITAGVARFLTGLDNERITVARALGEDVIAFKEHYERSHGFPSSFSIADMTAELHLKRNGLPKGPTTLSTRYITEDVPYGLVVLERLGKLSAMDTPTTSSAITICAAIYGRDFRSENPFLGIFGETESA